MKVDSINQNNKTRPKERVTLIVPPVVVHHLDPHTGIPFMPHMAAHVAGALCQDGFEVKVIDCFGLQPNQREVTGDLMLLGLPVKQTADMVDPDSKVCLIYCRTIAEFLAVEKMVKSILTINPEMKVCLFENIQAVTSFSLKDVANNFLDKGIHVLAFGEPEKRIGKIINRLSHDDSIEDIDGLAFRDQHNKTIFTPAATLTDDLDDLPRPAWELFPLEGYWTAGFAHAPCKKERFLPILTSRGCPFRCKFCLSPFVNPTWRARSAEHVVDELEYFNKNMKITDFHVSDLNPTVNEKRIQKICNEILNRKLKITWKLAQGTKIETIKSRKTLELMAAAGCKFIAFSPETGSKALLKSVNKPFDHEHGLKMAKIMVELGINVQTCFIVGLPAETPEDQKQTIDYVKKLIKLGVDEVGCYIFTPVPGSELAHALKGYQHYSQCTPSPSWREDYSKINRFRLRLYLTYFIYKLYHPQKVFREIKGLLTRQFETKMAMSLYKQGKLFFLRFFPGIFTQTLKKNITWQTPKE